MDIYTRRQGQTTISQGQYLIVDALGNNLEVVKRVTSGAFVNIYKMGRDNQLSRVFF